MNRSVNMRRRTVCARASSPFVSIHLFHSVIYKQLDATLSVAALMDRGRAIYVLLRPLCATRIFLLLYTLDSKILLAPRAFISRVIFSLTSAMCRQEKIFHIAVVVVGKVTREREEDEVSTFTRGSRDLD